MTGPVASPLVNAPALPARVRTCLMDFFVHVRRRWYLYLPLLLIWALAYVRVFFLPAPQVPVLFNITPSLPYRVALLRPLPIAPERGTYVLYRFEGDVTARYPGMQGQPIFKQVTGLPGDLVEVHDRDVFVNGVPMGEAKSHSFDGWPLATIAPTIIPEGHYYVRGTSPDSLDSRYAASGLVHRDQMLGRVDPWF